MKRAIFVSVGTVVGLTATLRYTPPAPNLDGANLALGGSLGTDPAPSATPETGSPLPVPSISPTATSASVSPSATSATSSATSKSTPDPRGTSKSTPKPTTTKKPSTTPTKKPSPTPTKTESSGTFLGSVAAARPYGVVQVQIEVKSKKITKISVLKFPNADQDSIDISVPALNTLISEALNAQSANIASVSGASHTSDGFKQSLASAIQKAGL